MINLKRLIPRTRARKSTQNSGHAVNYRSEMLRYLETVTRTSTVTVPSMIVIFSVLCYRYLDAIRYSIPVLVTLL